MALPTLRQLQYFLAVAETLSITQAAKNCHITQPALSAALSELEEILGEKILQRTKRNVSLTQIGEELVPLARNIISQTENLVRLAQIHREPLTGSLSLGVIPTIAPYLLPQILPALQKAYPSLDLKLKEDITQRQLEDLERGLIDVILMALPYDTKNTEVMELWGEPFFLARAGKMRGDNIALKLEALQSETVLLLDDGHCLRDHIISACRLPPASAPRKTLGATSLQTLIQMVQHGYGVTLLPAMAIDPATLPSGIAIQRFTNPQPYRTIGLVWRKDDPRGIEFKLLGEFISKTHAANKRK